MALSPFTSLAESSKPPNGAVSPIAELRSKAKLQVNRIPGVSLGVRVNLNRGQIWLLVAIKIANRKMWRRQSETRGRLRYAQETGIVGRRGFRRSSERSQTKQYANQDQSSRDGSCVHRIRNNCSAKPRRIAKTRKANRTDSSQDTE